MDGEGDHSGYDSVYNVLSDILDHQSSFDEDGVDAGSCDYSICSDAFELGSNQGRSCKVERIRKLLTSLTILPSTQPYKASVQ